MYISHAPGNRNEHASAQGLSDDTPEQQFRNSFATIKVALELNPRTGYVKGSSARRKLEAAFESVPLCFALDLGQHLVNSQGPLAKLFRNRLHSATQKSMILILVRKANECQQPDREKLRRLEEEQRHRDLETCSDLKKIDSLNEEICRLTGESSGQCRNAKSEALKVREQVLRRGVRCP